MHTYQEEFLKLALEREVLRFGQFTLKSGRVSPYFFNLGQIASGLALSRLADAYATAIAETGVEFDVLFGPAYKGIPLAATVAVSLSKSGGRDVGFAYNRKEAKDHGEGGVLVGAPVAGKRVLLIDDVLTAGTALRSSLTQLRAVGANPVGAIIALDRQERGPSGVSAVTEIRRDEKVPVFALVGVGEMLEYLLKRGGADASVIDSIREYQVRHGVEGDSA